MNKIWLVMRREFLNRVQKRSFLIATILLPLIFPTIMALMVYAAVRQQEGQVKEVVYYIDESDFMVPDTTHFIFRRFNGSLDDAKAAMETDTKSFGLLYIPKIDINDPHGITLYANQNRSPSDIGEIERMLEQQLKDVKMQRANISRSVLESLNTDVKIQTVRRSAGGKEESANLDLLFGAGVTCGILMYMFIFIYGAQIMQGVIEEKTSKVVEVIISSVRPFQLMMGKIMGLASVGLLQFLIWIVLITTLSTVVFSYFGVQPPPQELAQGMTPPAPPSGATEMATALGQIPFAYMIVNFLFYFLGGYLLYGALFAAVGSSVDSPAEAQQFMFPITIPMLIAYLSLFIFIREGHDESIAFWLSIIPFTSPIAMMGRLGFGVPWWELLLSQVLLIAGFILTTWVAGRIYRVGILMHGTKVNYRVLAKWFMMRN